MSIKNTLVTGRMIITSLERILWDTSPHAVVEVNLGSQDGSSSSEFVAFPRNSYRAPFALHPSDILEGCMLTPPSGYVVINPNRLVMLYDQPREGDTYQLDILADAARRAKEAVQARCNGDVVSSHYADTWNSDNYSMVEITLEPTDRSTDEVELRFVASPRGSSASPAAIKPSTVLGKCEFPWVGFVVVSPSKLVILYDRAQEGDLNEATLRDVATAIDEICVDISARYRVEKHTHRIIAR